MVLKEGRCNVRAAFCFQCNVSCTLKASIYLFDI